MPYYFHIWTIYGSFYYSGWSNEICIICIKRTSNIHKTGLYSFCHLSSFRWFRNFIIKIFFSPQGLSLSLACCTVWHHGFDIGACVKPMLPQRWRFCQWLPHWRGQHWTCWWFAFPWWTDKTHGKGEWIRSFNGKCYREGFWWNLYRNPSVYSQNAFLEDYY